MIGYKVKASMLALSLLVTLTGSVLTIEQWEQLKVHQQIEIIEKHVALGDSQKALLIEMLESRDDPEELRKAFSEKVGELRIKVGGESNPIKRIKYRDAADAFESSIKRLDKLTALEKTMNETASRIDNAAYSQKLRDAAQLAIAKLQGEYEKEKSDLKEKLVQGFIALKVAEDAEKILLAEKDTVEKNKPMLSELSLAGVCSLIFGLISSLLIGGKTYFDYKKSKIDLELAKIQLQEQKRGH